MVSLKVTQIDMICETKTRDNVFVNIHLSILYKVIPDKVVTAFYSFVNLEDQIRYCQYIVWYYSM